MGIIYYIKNIKNNMIYIGMSTCIDKRFNRHKNLLKNNKHFNYKLQNDYNNYGANCFEYGVLVEANKETLEKLEEFYICKFTKQGTCYNIRMNNNSISEETKSKISNNTKKAMSSELVKAKLRKPVSDETKAKISEALKRKYKENPNLLLKMSLIAKNRERKPLSESEKEKFRGSNNGNSKVKEKDVINIRLRRKNGEQRKNVYKDYKDIISERNFKAIWLYQNWKHIEV